MTLRAIAYFAIAMTCISSTSYSQSLPSQFIAKTYTEALGRAPDGTGWWDWHNYFDVNGKNINTLKAFAKIVFTSQEYKGINYDNGDKVITLYRTLLCREPDLAGFTGIKALLDGGTPIETVVESFCDPNGEMKYLLPGIWSGGGYNGAASGDFPGSLPRTFVQAPTKPTDTYLVGSNIVWGSDLQYIIDHVSEHVIMLGQRAVIKVDKTIVLKNGKTLCTYSNPSNPLTRYKYVQFARLVRTTNFDVTGSKQASVYIPVIQVQTGSRLEHVFVDGGMSWHKYDGAISNIQVRTVDGSQAEIFECRSSNVQSGSGMDIEEYWSGPNYTPDIRITNNLIACYETGHNNTNADGITCKMGNCTIQGNQVVDATDVCIVLQNVGPLSTSNQGSHVFNNTVVNAGKSAIACFCYDGITHANKTSATELSFNNARIDHNLVLMGYNKDKVNFDFVITSSLPWDFPGRASHIKNIVGYLWINNNYFVKVNCNTGILLSNINGLSVWDNWNERPLNMVSTFSNSNNLVHGMVIVPSTLQNWGQQNNGGFSDDWVTVNVGDVFDKIAHGGHRTE
jgi:hypothetical protein